MLRLERQGLELISSESLGELILEVNGIRYTIQPVTDRKNFQETGELSISISGGQMLVSPQSSNLIRVSQK